MDNWNSPRNTYLLIGNRERALTPLEIEKEFLSPQTAAITAEFTVLSHDPVARYDDRDAIITVRSSYSALRSQPSHVASLLLIADGLAVWNALKSLPCRHLEGRSFQH